MNECLVTRLRASVSDENLKKLGVFAVKLDSTEKTYIVNLAGKNVVASIIGNGYFMNTQNVNLGKSITLSEEGSAYWYSASSPIVVEFRQKYGLTKFNFTTGDISLQTLDEFDYMTELVELQGISVKENIDAVDKTYNNILTFSFSPISQVSGKVESFARIFPNVKNIRISNGDNGSATLNIQGDIKDMIAQFISQGRTTDTISIGASYKDVKTFFGAKPQAASSISGVLHWDSAEKAYMTNPSTKKVFAHGYTESEHSSILANYAGYDIVRIGQVVS